MALVSAANLATYWGRALTTAESDLLTLLQPLVDAQIKDYLGFAVEQATYTEWYPDRQMAPERDDLVDGGPWDVVGNRAYQYGAAGSNNQVIALRQLPVRSITTVHENPAAWDDSASTPSFPASTLLTDYQVDYQESGISWSGHLFRRTGSWFWSQMAQRTVQVVYVAGFTSGEMDARFPLVKLASLEALTQAISQAKAQVATMDSDGSGLITSEKLDSWSVQYEQGSSDENTGLLVALPKSVLRKLEPYVRLSRYV